MEGRGEKGEEWGRMPGDGQGAARGPRRVARDFGARMEHRLNWTVGAAAERLAHTAGRLDRFAGEHTATASGATARAGSMARSVAEMMEATADFLRGNDVGSLGAELRRQVRQHPIQTLFIGVAAGWATGKILR